MADMLELSAQYYVAGTNCRGRLVKLEQLLRDSAAAREEYELKRQITMLTAMSRDCIATANYLRAYCERREQLEQLRRQQAGI